MTTVESRPPARDGSAPPFGRLLRTEFRRLVARRFTQVLLVLSVVGYLAAMAFLWADYAQPTDQDIARATAARDASIVETQQSIQSCVDAGQPVEVCGVAPTVADYPIDYFLDNRPFTPELVPNLTLSVGVAVAMAGFILGATFIGAEWSSRTIVAWLYFEPRRLRLLGAKLLALMVAVVALAFLAQVIWLLTAQLLLSQRGIPVSTLGSEAERFWPTMVETSSRAALLVVPVTVLGFALANLLRNTAAAFGVGFVYFAIVETVLGGISPNLQPYQFTVGLQAWVTDGGITVYGNLVYDQQSGGFSPEEIPVSSLHGAVVMVAYAVVVLAVSVWVFRRRDIT